MKNAWLKSMMAGLAVGFFMMNAQPAHGQVLAVWGWRNVVAPQFGGPWIAPDVRFRPLGILDGDPIWRRGDQALLILNVPDDNASVWIQGQPMPGSGKQRAFVIPPLDPGLRYSYEVRVRWGTGSQFTEETRMVPIRPGQEVIVNFPAPKRMPPADQ